MKRTLLATTFALASIITGGACAQQDPATARAEIETLFGGMPSYLKVYPEAALGAGWALMKGVNMNQDMVLDAKTRELVSLAVAAQIPCDYCIYYHRKAAVASGATEEELREAVVMAAVIRHWSTILHGAAYDMEAFKAETDGMFSK